MTLQATCGCCSASADSSAAIDGPDLVAAHRLEDLIRLSAVDMLVRALTRGCLRRHRPQIGGNDAVGARPLSQRGDQLRADLSQRACHENATHVCPTCSNRRAARVPKAPCGMGYGNGRTPSCPLQRRSRKPRVLRDAREERAPQDEVY